MAETDEKPDAKYVGLWEVHLKAVNSLLIAHGAGLVACLTLLKDYDTTPHLKHIGWFIGLFAFGLSQGGTVAPAGGNTCAPRSARLDLKAPRSTTPNHLSGRTDWHRCQWHGRRG